MIPWYSGKGEKMDNENRNDLYQGTDLPQEEGQPLSPEEMPPIDSFDQLFSEEIESNKDRSPEKMYETPGYQLARLAFWTIVCYIGLCAVTVFFCNHLWIEMNGPVMMIANAMSIIFGALIIAMLGLVGYYVIHGITHRSETLFSNIVKVTVFGLLCYVASGLTYIFVPASKLLFILITAGLIAIGFLFIRKIKEPEYSLNVIVMVSFFIFFLIFAFARVFLVTVLYNGMNYTIDYYYVQSADAGGMTEPDHVMQCNAIRNYEEDENIFYLSTLDDISFNNVAFVDEAGVDHFFDKRIEYLDEIENHTPETRQIEQSIRELLEPELQKYDSDYFRNDLIYLIPVFYSYKTNAVTLDKMYVMKGVLTLDSKAGVISDEENNGICFMMIKMSKQQANMLSLSGVSCELDQYG